MILLFYTGVYLVLALKSQRFLEYFIPVAVLTIAMFFETNRVFITNHSKATATAGILVIIFGLIGLTNIYNRQVIALRQQLSDYPLAMDAAQELQRHLKPGDIVFTQSWSDPPALFFNAPEFYYLNFLDPYFMYHRNPEKFTIWQRVKAGESKNPLREIQRQFNARAVFIRALPQDYISKLEAQLTEQLCHGPYKTRQRHKVFILPEKINPPVKSNKQVP